MFIFCKFSVIAFDFFLNDFSSLLCVLNVGLLCLCFDECQVSYNYVERKNCIYSSEMPRTSYGP